MSAADPSVRAGPTTRLATIVLVVAAYAGLLYLPFLGSARTLTAHEGMVTQPALRMLNDGSWIVPYYTQGFWLDKPPLLSWITAGVFAASGGFSEFGARLPAALSAIGLSVLMAVLAARFFDRRTAVLAGLVQASSVYLLLQGRLGEIDVPFTLLVAGALTALAWTWGRGEIKLNWAPALAFHALAGLAVLAKGPVALAFLGVTVLGFCLLRRSLRPLVAVIWTPAIIVFLLLTVSWHAGAVLVAGDEAWQQWNDNYLRRIRGEHHLGREPFWFYFKEIPWLMLPWTIALVIGAAIWTRRRRERMEELPTLEPSARWFNGFLWCWFLGGLLFVSLSAFKHKHYCFPILPPLSIVAARVLSEHIRRVPRHAPRFYAIVFATIAIAFIFINALVMPRRDPRRETVQFIREHVNTLPADARVLVVGLAQHAAYPYIQRQCIYVREAREGDASETLADVRNALAEPANHPLWVLTLRQYVQPAAESGLVFSELAAEPARKRIREHETLVLLKPEPSPASAPGIAPAAP
jgi:4-amino-4-deoxy-L-arabinose transferase-like glycosyltransferase